MHNYETITNTSINNAIDEIMGFKFQKDVDYDNNTYSEVTDFVLATTIFAKKDDAVDYSRNYSYHSGGSTAGIAIYIEKKKTAGFRTALNTFNKKYLEYIKFKKSLYISNVTKSIRISCPKCHSSFLTSYVKYYKACPVCGSQEIIPKKYLNKLNSLFNAYRKAGNTLSKKVQSLNGEFVCSVGWHN